MDPGLWTQQPALAACLPCPLLLSGLTVNTTNATATRVGLSHRSRPCAGDCVSVWYRSGGCGFCLSPSLLRAHHIVHGNPPPSFGLARWHTRQCAPAPPPFCGVARILRRRLSGTRAGVVRNSFVVRLETDLKHSLALPPSHTQQPTLLLALLLAATISHDHQRDSMLSSLATKAGAMARRRGALFGTGKVACVDAPWGGGSVGGRGEGRSVHATASCPRYVDPFSSAYLPCMRFNLCCVDKRPREVLTHKHIHTRQQGRDAGCGGRSSRHFKRGRGQTVGGGPRRSTR